MVDCTWCPLSARYQRTVLIPVYPSQDTNIDRVSHTVHNTFRISVVRIGCQGELSRGPKTSWWLSLLAHLKGIKLNVNLHRDDKEIFKISWAVFDKQSVRDAHQEKKKHLWLPGSKNRLTAKRGRRSTQRTDSSRQFLSEEIFFRRCKITPQWAEQANTGANTLITQVVCDRRDCAQTGRAANDCDTPVRRTKHACLYGKPRNGQKR